MGITHDIKIRMNTYQTADPFRRFMVEKYKFLEDTKKLEQEILKEFGNKDNGEWLPNDHKETIISKYW